MNELWDEHDPEYQKYQQELQRHKKFVRHGVWSFAGLGLITLGMFVLVPLDVWLKPERLFWKIALLSLVLLPGIIIASINLVKTYKYMSQ